LVWRIRKNFSEPLR